MFLGENLLAYLILALGGALAAGNIMAIVKPPQKAKEEGDLEKAPVARSIFMAVIGVIATLWALASLVK